MYRTRTARAAVSSRSLMAVRCSSISSTPSSLKFLFSVVTIPTSSSFALRSSPSTVCRHATAVWMVSSRLNSFPALGPFTFFSKKLIASCSFAPALVALYPTKYPAGSHLNRLGPCSSSIPTNMSIAAIGRMYACWVYTWKLSAIRLAK